MSTFVEFHILRSFPPSNLNRDDLGSPKSALFGGSRRLRISSQCLKRTWRTSEHFSGAFAEADLGIRTDRLPEEVLKALGAKLPETAQKGLVTLLTSIGLNKKKADTGGDGEDESSDEAASSATETQSTDARTPHLLFMSRQEIDTVIAFARENEDALIKVFSGKKVNADKLKKLREELKEYLQEKTKRNAADIGLFGRFVTSDEFDTIDAALQVAHGLGTQKIEVEYDYFTAVDDLSKETGAGHLGETEFASSVLYLYACCDLGQLERNLGARSRDGRLTDGDAQKLARKSLPALVRAMSLATPTGKKTGTAPHTPAEFVEVVLRRGSPLSFANAFLKPVGVHEGEGDVMAGSITRFVEHRNTMEKAYARDADVIGRFVLCLRPVEGAADPSARVESMPALEKKLAESLKALPAQAS